MSRGRIRRAVIQRLAESRRVPLAVAAHIYSLKSIEDRHRLCLREEERQAKAATAKKQTVPTLMDALRVSIRESRA